MHVATNKDKTVLINQLLRVTEEYPKLFLDKGNPNSLSVSVINKKTNSIIFSACVIEAKKFSVAGTSCDNKSIYDVAEKYINTYFHDFAV